MGPMMRTLYVVAELPQFLRDVTAVGLSEAEHQAIIDAVAANPLRGDEIRASVASGKCALPAAAREKAEAIALSRPISTNLPVYLVALLSKGERENFTAAEIAAFKKLTSEIARWRRRTT